MLLPRHFMLAAAVSCAVAHAQPSEAPAGHLLHFDNGDVLTGSLIGIDERGDILLQRGSGESPLTLPRRDVADLWHTDSFAMSRESAASYVTLANGDVIPADSLNADAESVHFQTALPGGEPQMRTLLRSLVRSVEITPWDSTHIFHGPTSIEGWHELSSSSEADSPPPALRITPAPAPTQSGWRYQGGGLVSSGKATVSPDIDLPERSHLAFTIDFSKATTANAFVAFHCDFTIAAPPDAEASDKQHEHRKSLRPNDNRSLAYIVGRGFVITFNGRYLNLIRTEFNKQGIATAKKLVSQNIPRKLTRKTQHDLVIRTDRERKHIVVYIDGKFVLQWQPSRNNDVELADAQDGLAFGNLSESSQLRLSSVEVASWNGLLEDASAMTEPDRDLVLLANGLDRASGQLLSVDADTVQFQATYGQLDFPRSGVAELLLSGVAPAPAELAEKSVVVHLSPRGQITGVLQPSTGDTIIIDTPTVGELHLSHASIYHIDFMPGEHFLPPWDLP